MKSHFMLDAGRHRGHDAARHPRSLPEIQTGQMAGKQGSNKQVAAFAKKGLPILEKHLEKAQKLAGGAPTQTQ